MEGSNMRQFYQGKYPSVEPDRWLPASCDHAVIGMAERRDELAPVYQYNSLLNIIPSAGAERRFSTVTDVLMSYPRVNVLHTPARRAFWERVEAGELLAWELLTPAIVGVMSYGVLKPHATVYDRVKVVDILASSVMDSRGESPVVLALNDYRNKLLACSAGIKTPWYYYTDED